MKKIYILIACLFAAAACVIGIVYFTQKEDERDRGEVLEELRDTIKEFVPPGTDDTLLYEESQPEHAEILPETETLPETEKSPVTEETPPETEKKLPETEMLPEKVPSEPAEPEPAVPDDVPEPPAETQADTVPETAAPAADEPVSSRALLDFTDLQKLNPDICAWIEIEGTKVDYPVLQSPEDDKRYLSTAYDGSYYIGGSLFTEKTYNSRDFNDPVTVIYGHTMRAGTLFGQLQSVYSDPVTFESCSKINLYLPDETRSYTVFAAVPYQSIHILHTYDFTKKYWFNNFFDSVKEIRSLYANFNEDAFPVYGDRVLILSTCLNEDSTQRFLVMAVLDE